MSGDLMVNQWLINGDLIVIDMILTKQNGYVHGIGDTFW
jgi:hypothetical protein